MKLCFQHPATPIIPALIEEGRPKFQGHPQLHVTLVTGPQVLVGPQTLAELTLWWKYCLAHKTQKVDNTTLAKMKEKNQNKT